MGVKFLKYDSENNVWIGVKETDEACPISSLMQTIFRDIEVVSFRMYSLLIEMYLKVRVGNRSIQTHSGMIRFFFPRICEID